MSLCLIKKLDAKKSVDAQIYNKLYLPCTQHPVRQNMSQLLAHEVKNQNAPTRFAARRVEPSASHKVMGAGFIFLPIFSLLLLCYNNKTNYKENE